jgi:hypothetical protein
MSWDKNAEIAETERIRPLTHVNYYSGWDDERSRSTSRDRMMFMHNYPLTIDLA